LRRLFSFLYQPTTDQAQKLWMIDDFALTMYESFTQVLDIIFPEPLRMFFFKLKKCIQKPNQTNY